MASESQLVARVTKDKCTDTVELKQDGNGAG